MADIKASISNANSSIVASLNVDKKLVATRLLTGKDELGLNNVENKSSATIRSEIVDSDIPSTITRNSDLPSQVGSIVFNSPSFIGNVGINTETPTEALDVVGKIKSSDNITSGGNAIIAGNITSSAGGLTLGTSSSFSYDVTIGTFLKVKSDAGDTLYDTLKADSSNTRVGIGNSSPERTLHVKADVSDNGGQHPLRVEGASSSIIEIKAGDDSSFSGIDFGDSSNTHPGSIVYNHSNNSMFFDTNDATRMTIDSSGNITMTGDLTVDTNTLFVDSTNNRVGINTTSPLRDLEVNGRVLIQRPNKIAANLDVTGPVRVTHDLFKDSGKTNMFGDNSNHFHDITRINRITQQGSGDVKNIERVQEKYYAIQNNNIKNNKAAFWNWHRVTRPINTSDVSLTNLTGWDVSGIQDSSNRQATSQALFPTGGAEATTFTFSSGNNPFCLDALLRITIDIDFEGAIVAASLFAKVTGISGDEATVVLYGGNYKSTDEVADGNSQTAITENFSVEEIDTSQYMTLSSSSPTIDVLSDSTRAITTDTFSLSFASSHGLELNDVITVLTDATGGFKEAESAYVKEVTSTTEAKFVYGRLLEPAGNLALSDLSDGSVVGILKGSLDGLHRETAGDILFQFNSDNVGRYKSYQIGPGTEVGADCIVIGKNIYNKDASTIKIGYDTPTLNIDSTGIDVIGNVVSSTSPTSGNHLTNKTYVDAQVAGIVDSAPESLNTLNELAAALNDSPAQITDILTAIGQRLAISNNLSDLDSPAAARANLGLGTSNNVTFNQITGTLQTVTQPNIRSVGSLTTLNVAAEGSSDGKVTCDALTADAFTVTGSGGGISYNTNAFTVDTNGDTVIAGSLSVDTNTLFVDSNNNRVGIGTGSPGTPLAVIGASTLNGTVKIPTVNASLTKQNCYNKTGGIRLQKATATTDEISMRYEGANSNNFVIEQISSNATKGQIKFIGGQNILRLGNSYGSGVVEFPTITKILNTMNIGTSGSSKKIVFKDSRTFDHGLHFEHTGISKVIQMGMYGSFGDDVNERGAFHIKSQIGTNTIEDILSIQGTSSDVNITKNLGLSIASPSNKLHIKELDAGNVKRGIRLQNSSTTVGTGTGIAFGNTSSNTFISATIDSTRTSSTANGNLIFSTRADNTGAVDAVIERMRIETDGKVGIGVTSPTEILDVSGNIKTSGNISAGGTITGNSIVASNMLQTTGDVEIDNCDLGINGGTVSIGGPAEFNDQVEFQEAVEFQDEVNLSSSSLIGLTDLTVDGNRLAVDGTLNKVGIGHTPTSSSAGFTIDAESMKFEMSGDVGLELNNGLFTYKIGDISEAETGTYLDIDSTNGFARLHGTGLSIGKALTSGKRLDVAGDALMNNLTIDGGFIAAGDCEVQTTMELTGGAGINATDDITTTGIVKAKGYALDTNTFTVVSTTSTLASSTNGLTVILQNTGPITITLPTLTAGHVTTFIAETINPVTFIGDTGVTVNSFAGNDTTAGQFAQCQVIYKTSTIAFLGGNLV